jgi:hypothetical protein
MGSTLRVLRPLEGILSRVPFKEPYLSDRFNIATNELSGLPDIVKRFFDITFIYTQKARFEACCILQKAEKTYTIIIIMAKDYELDFKKQCDIPNILERDLSKVCRRRELYCHEICHLIAIIRAFPDYVSVSENNSFIKKLFYRWCNEIRNEKEFFAITRSSFRTTLTDIETLIKMSFPVSFTSIGDSPSDFNKDHFPYPGDELNYFRLFNELMVKDADLEKMIEKLPERIRDKKAVAMDKGFDLDKYFRDFLHVELAFIMRKAPEKKQVLISAIQKYQVEGA